MTRFSKLVFGLLLCSLAALTPAVHAAPATFRVLMDTDNSSATGCTVSGMDGVDQILVTTVEIGATSAAVTGTSLGHCGTPTLTPITTSGWPAGYHAPSGRLLVETRIPLSMFQLASNSDLPRNMRIGIEATKGDQTQTVLTDSDGSLVFLPEPPHGRRRAVAAPGSPRTFTLDGLDTEWLPLDEKFDGVGSGGSFGLRILRAFAFVNPTDNFIYFLFDSNVSTDAPFADDDRHKRVPGQETLDIPAPGVLGNDVDSNTPPEPLTARPVSAPLHGTVIVNSDGSFTYTPENPSSRTADVFEYRANNGIKDSNTAKVKIKVGIGADDAYHGPAGTPINIAAPGVLENDDSGNIDGLTATLLSEPSHGDVTLNPNGGFTYTPDSGFTGDDTFSYTVSGHGPSDTATVTITIDPKEQGQDNQPPHVLKDKFKVDENAPAGTLVGKARVTDPNSGDTHTWAILSGNIGNAFAINANSGQITVLTPSAINFEVRSHYDLSVRATDNGTPPLSDAETIQIDVNNKNDAPVANPQSLVTTEGTPIPVTLTASDEDGNTLTYTVIVNPQHGVLTGSAPNLTYTPNAGFGGVDTFTFRANDGTANSNAATITITVRVVPTITSGNSANFQATVASTFTVTTTGYPTPSITETGALPNGITFHDNGNGTASLGGIAAELSGGVYVITINATNVAGSATPQTFTITVCNTINVTNPGTTTGTAGSPFSQNFTQTGAVGSATFTLASGTLPAGLTLATNGTLSGTPTQTGSFPITVTVTDANGCTGTGATYNLVIGCQTITVNNPANANGTASSPFSETFTQTGAIGGATFTLASGTLPAGLTLATNGTLSGTPTQVGSFPITVTATDANGCTRHERDVQPGHRLPDHHGHQPGQRQRHCLERVQRDLHPDGRHRHRDLHAGQRHTAGRPDAGRERSALRHADADRLLPDHRDRDGCERLHRHRRDLHDRDRLPGHQRHQPGQRRRLGERAHQRDLHPDRRHRYAGLHHRQHAAGRPDAGHQRHAVRHPDADRLVPDHGHGHGRQRLHRHGRDVHAGDRLPDHHRHLAGQRQRHGLGAVQRDLHPERRRRRRDLHAGHRRPPGRPDAGHQRHAVRHPDADRLVPDHGHGHGRQRLHRHERDLHHRHRLPDHHRHQPGHGHRHRRLAVQPDLHAERRHRRRHLHYGQHAADRPDALRRRRPLRHADADRHRSRSWSRSRTPTAAPAPARPTRWSSAARPSRSTTRPTPAAPPRAPFSETFTQTGAIGGATFTLNSGTLPTGLTLAANGVLSGTPTQTGSFPITVTVTDGNGCTGISATYTIVIACQTITVTNPATTTGTAATAFSQTFTQSGAIGTPIFSLDSGTLPAGLTLATNGVLSGTPTQTGSFPITVTATDANGCTGIGATYTLVIGCQTITVTNPATTTGTVERAVQPDLHADRRHRHGDVHARQRHAAGRPDAGRQRRALRHADADGQLPDHRHGHGRERLHRHSATYTLVIGCQTITVTNPANANGTISTPFSETFSQSGAIGTATFTTASTLPAGITLPPPACSPAPRRRAARSRSWSRSRTATAAPARAPPITWSSPARPSPSPTRPSPPARPARRSARRSPRPAPSARPPSPPPARCRAA